MTIKSFEEIKTILKQRRFREASGIGYVIVPQLIKIAMQVGLVGYEQAFVSWGMGSVMKEKVYQPKEEIKESSKLLISWEGPRLLKTCKGLKIGLKATIEDIEEATK